MSTDDRYDSDGLRARVRSGLVWVGASQAGLQIIRVVTAIIIARLLVPEEYGLAALALVFSSLVLIFSDLALGAAIIQRQDLTISHKNTAFWVTVAAGFFFALLGVLSSGVIASLYGDEAVQPLIAVLSASFVFSALGSVQQCLMVRDMDFRRVEVLPMAGTAVGGVCGIALALAGAGAWAIIGQYLVTVAITTLLAWVRSSWKPQFSFSLASLRDLAGFSGNMLGHRLLYYTQTNADRFLIGKFLGTASLGIYAIAINTIIQPASKVGGPLQRLLSPVFCRIQEEPERIAAIWIRATRVLAAITVPALLGLAVMAPDFVPVVLGDQWDAAVPVVQILALVGIVQALQSLSVDVLMARNHTRTIFRFSILLCVCHVTAIAIGLQWGITGVAAAFAVSTVLIEPIQSVLAARCLGVSPMALVRGIVPVFQAGVGMALIVLMSRYLLLETGIGDLLRLLICTAIGAACFFGLCAWRVPELLNEVNFLLKRQEASSPPIGEPELVKT